MGIELRFLIQQFEILLIKLIGSPNGLIPLKIKLERGKE